MIYGLYLSASGVMANAYRQDVIANNLANVETSGFKRDLATFHERRNAVAESGGRLTQASLYEPMSGGLWASRTYTDHAPGPMEPTDNPLDMAIEGDGYFMVENARGERRLTRDGQMGRNDSGHLVLLNRPDHRVLDARGRRITMLANHPVNVAEDGSLMQKGRVVGRVGVYQVADPQSLAKEGESMWSGDLRSARAARGVLVRGRYVEGSNVEVSTELAALMNTQRQLEANANMIRYQDQTLARLVNDVGKIG